MEDTIKCPECQHKNPESPYTSSLKKQDRISSQISFFFLCIFSANNITSSAWERRFRENDFIYGRIQGPDEVITDPQSIANDFFAELDHPVEGLKLVNTPVKFRQAPALVRTPAPELGQHTEEILLNLNYGWEDIAQLKEQGVIL
ncbi:MAG: CoA transferase [Desulfobacteraceae bacterium]|nr:CoA transferase [Desulfobacteraceae bacterium]